MYPPVIELFPDDPLHHIPHPVCLCSRVPVSLPIVVLVDFLFSLFLHDVNRISIIFDSIPQSVIILGFLIFLIAFLGCCGALIESHCILLTFGIIVTVILALELTIAGLAFAFKADLRNAASRELREAVTKYNWTDPESRYSKLIDQMQSSMRCCGFNSTSDWVDLNPNPQDRTILPDSCCPRSSNHTSGPTLRETLLDHPSSSGSTDRRQKGSCHAPGFLNRYSNPASRQPVTSGSFDFDSSGVADRPDPLAPSSSAASSPDQGKELAPFSVNCVDVFVDALIGLIGPIGLVCLAVAIFQLLGITFAFCLSKAVRREYQVV